MRRTITIKTRKRMSSVAIAQYVHSKDVCHLLGLDGRLISIRELRTPLKNTPRLDQQQKLVGRHQHLLMDIYLSHYSVVGLAMLSCSCSLGKQHTHYALLLFLMMVICLNSDHVRGVLSFVNKQLMYYCVRL